MTTTFTITTTGGREVTRRSDADYVAASEAADGRVRFHRSHAAAERAAGTYGTVHAIAPDVAATGRKCRVCEDGRVPNRRASTGVVEWHDCWRCDGTGRVAS